MKSATAKIEHKTVAFSIKADDQLNEREFSGYAAVFGNLDSTGDIIMPGAFAETLAEFLSDGVIAWQHSWREPIGKPLSATEDSKGLYLKGKLSDTTQGRDSLTLVRDGVIQKLSIGYRTVESQYFETVEELMSFAASNNFSPKIDDLNGVYGGVRVLKKIKLYEVSLVTVPANPEASITAVKSLDELIDPEGNLLGGMPFEEHYRAVLAAVAEIAMKAETTQRGLQGLILRRKAIDEKRAEEKEGRTISAANRTRMEACCTGIKDTIPALQGVHDSIVELMAMAEPKPKKSEEEAADPALVASLIAQYEHIKLLQAERG